MVCCTLPLSPYAAKRVLPGILFVGVLFQVALGIVALYVLNIGLMLWILGSMVYHQYCAEADLVTAGGASIEEGRRGIEKCSVESGGGGGKGGGEYGEGVCNSSSSPPRPPPHPPSRILYLDNLKTFLTVLVVLHHIVIQFGGQPGNWVIQIGLYKNSFQVFISFFTMLNQSYFMCLFFFISAYFVPSSVDKRGATVFLKERFKRLGWPFLVTLFFLWPLLDLTVHYFIGNGDDYSYIPAPGPLWFAAWLLVFSYAYTLCGGPVVVLSCPSVRVLCAAGLVLGLLQGLLMVGMPFGFMFMPISFGSLPFDVCFFMAGIFCRRNKWLDEAEADSCTAPLIAADDPSPSPPGSGPGGSLLRFIDAHRLFLYSTSMLVAVAFLVTVTVFDVADISQPFIQTNPGDDDGRDDDQDDPNPSPSGPALRNGVMLCVFCLLSGVFTFTMSLCALDFFRKYFSFTSDRSAYMAGAAYAVYIIHPWVITPLLFVWIKIVEHMTGEDIYFVNGGVFSYTDVGSDAYLWGGFVFVSVFALPACWLLGGKLKKLPGLRDVL